MNEQILQRRARRLARSLDLRIEKSRTRKFFHLNDKGHYRIINNWRNEVVAGDNYDLKLPEVMEWLLAQ